MIIDIIVVAILLLSAYTGYKKGLISILVGFISLILAIIIAFLFQGTLADFLYNNTPVGTSVSKTVTNFVMDNLETTTQGENADKKDGNMLEILDMFISDEKEDVIIEDVSSKITMYILRGISFIALLVIVMLICYIITMLLNFVFSFPILDSINRFGGIGINLVKTLVKVWIVFAIISFVSTLPMIDPIVEQINNSMLSKLLYNNNLLVGLIQGTIKL